MKSEIRVATSNLRVIVPVTLISAATVIILALLFRFEFGVILLAIGGSVLLVGSAAAINAAGRLLHHSAMRKIERHKAHEELRIVRAQAARAELESYVLHFSKNERVIMSEAAPVRMIEAVTSNNTEQQTETIEQQPLDLLTVFTQVTQSYAIIGGQQSGKTYQARHIAAYWLRRGIQPWVVGPKWDRGEWYGCQLFGGRGDMLAVGRGLEIVRQEAERRHANTDLGHKEHSILPVFFDDWTPIVDAVENARALVLEATTLYASVNIILYFVHHSDTANAWGVDRKGAALKDNFVKLFIEPFYNADGQVIRERTRGYIRFAGESIDRPARLFSGPVTVSVSTLASEELLDPEPTEQEQQILDLHREGESLSEICRQVFGNKGGKQASQVKAVLDQFS